MSAFLSDEWFAAVAAAGTDLGDARLSLTVMFEVAGAPGGKLRATAAIADGSLTSFVPEKHASPDCKIVIDADLAAAVIRAESDPEVAYMRGDLKLDGDYARVLFGLRDMTGSEQWRQFVEAVVSLTDW